MLNSRFSCTRVYVSKPRFPIAMPPFCSLGGRKSKSSRDYDRPESRPDATRTAGNYTESVDFHYSCT